MIEYKVKISTINDVKKFVNTVSKYDFDVDLINVRRKRSVMPKIEIINLRATENAYQPTM